MKFEERLRMIMNEQGLSQKELANKANITEASMSKYLSGERTPRADVIVNLSRALEISTDELLFDVDNNEAVNFIQAKTVLARGMGNMSDEEKNRIYYGNGIFWTGVSITYIVSPALSETVFSPIV